MWIMNFRFKIISRVIRDDVALISNLSVLSCWFLGTNMNFEIDNIVYIFNNQTRLLKHVQIILNVSFIESWKKRHQCVMLVNWVLMLLISSRVEWISQAYIAFICSIVLITNWIKSNDKYLLIMISLKANLTYKITFSLVFLVNTFEKQFSF